MFTQKKFKLNFAQFVKTNLFDKYFIFEKMAFTSPLPEIINKYIFLSNINLFYYIKNGPFPNIIIIYKNIINLI